MRGRAVGGGSSWDWDGRNRNGTAEAPRRHFGEHKWSSGHEFLAKCRREGDGGERKRVPLQRRSQQVSGRSGSPSWICEREEEQPLSRRGTTTRLGKRKAEEEEGLAYQFTTVPVRAGEGVRRQGRGRGRHLNVKTCESSTAHSRHSTGRRGEGKCV